jgi:hypothetical protein
MIRMMRACVARVLALAGLWITANVDAQENFVGYWAPLYHEDFEERLPGPWIGDYLGLPINAAARLRAESWDASLLSLPEHQCKPHPSTYGFRGIGLLRVWEDRSPETQEVVKLHTWIAWQEQRREIWMDGRPHPPTYARHTWQGFSTGSWENGVLTVRTTHLKDGWVRRNGAPLSDRATMTERFYRHGDLLTHVMAIEDPVYLTEPLVKSNGFALVTNPSLDPYPCEAVVEVVRPEGFVPHHLPGQNPFLAEFPTMHGLPLEAAQGGAATALPEYAERLR